MLNTPVEVYPGKVKKPRKYPWDMHDAGIFEHDVNDTWMWSDLHFGHKNIIKYSDRPFADISDMDRRLIDNFNSVTNKDSVSIWGGDITFYDENRSTEIVTECNGYKILIVGNHDFSYNSKVLKNMGFDEVYLLMTYVDNDVSLLFTHYPTKVAPDWVNIHGHEHIGKFSPTFSKDRQHININCEFHSYKPLPMTQVVEWAKTRTTSYDR